MPEKTISVNLPEALYEQVQRAADDSNRSLETLVTESLRLLFVDDASLPMNPDDLTDFTNDQLWAVVYRRLPWTSSSRLRDLSTMKTERSPAEQEEFERLLAQNDRLTLLRSQALLLLKQRGQNIEDYMNRV